MSEPLTQRQVALEEPRGWTLLDGMEEALHRRGGELEEVKVRKRGGGVGAASAERGRTEAVQGAAGAGHDVVCHVTDVAQSPPSADRAVRRLTSRSESRMYGRSWSRYGGYGSSMPDSTVITITRREPSAGSENGDVEAAVRWVCLPTCACVVLLILHCTPLVPVSFSGCCRVGPLIFRSKKAAYFYSRSKTSGLRRLLIFTPCCWYRRHTWLRTAVGEVQSHFLAKDTRELA